MDTANLMSTLVETYKQLNTKFRNGTDSEESRAIVRRMRDDEVQFSQALKDRITGVGTDTAGSGQYVDGADQTLAQLISQFGNVRATTLNLLKGITDNSVWTQSLDDGSTIEKHVADLAKSDQVQLQRLSDVATS